MWGIRKRNCFKISEATAVMLYDWLLFISSEQIISNINHDSTINYIAAVSAAFVMSTFLIISKVYMERQVISFK